jgi:cysteinyl-tRNA synthetase
VRRHDPEALRLYFLGTHYRHPLEYADERIAESAKALGRLRALVEEAERVARGGPQPPSAGDAALLEQVDAHVERFTAVMDDDFNTPQALGVLFDLLRLLYASRDQGAGSGAFVAGVGRLVELARVLGLLGEGARTQVPIDPKLKARIDSLVSLREQARRQREFAEADRLRDELVALGVTLKDSRGGTTWTISQ